MSYTNVHRLFVQVMMSHRFLTAKNTLEKYQQVCQALDDDEHVDLDIDDLQKLIGDINQRIKPINLEIRKGICETSSDAYFVLVNTVAVPLNLTFKMYTVPELEVFKKIIEEIVESPNGIASSISCINLNVTGMTKSDIESSIQKFIKDQWLIEMNGIYSLSVRTIAEMGPYLKSLYKDEISSCELCKEIIFQGFRCNECDTMVHLHCLKIYSNQTRASDKGLECPHPDCTEIIFKDSQAPYQGTDSHRGSVSSSTFSSNHQDSQRSEPIEKEMNRETKTKRRRGRDLHQH